MTDLIQEESSKYLIVDDALHGDQTIAYLSQEKMNELQLFIGDLVLLKGRKHRQTICVVHINDSCLIDHIQINSMIRRNLRVRCGDKIVIQHCQNVKYGTCIRVLPINGILQGKFGVQMDDDLKSYFNDSYRPVKEGDMFAVHSKMGLIEFKVLETEPSPYCIVTPDTTISCNDESSIRYDEDGTESFIEIRYDRIGGLESIKNEINQLTHGILFYGPPGCGKTLLVKAIANEYQANFMWIKCAELFTTYSNTVPQIFNQAQQMAPCLLFFDDFESLVVRQLGHDIIKHMIHELDNLDTTKNVFVIGATNRPDNLDSNLLQSGRFDRLFFISLPDEKARLEILQISTRKCPLANDVDLKILNRMMNGYTGADVKALCQCACELSVRESIEKQQDTSLQICQDHFERALKFTRGSITDNDMNKYKIFDQILQNKTGNYHNNDDSYS